ncbi:MAG TPA: polymer-forming cytoskeletal protein [Candidatus Acidoferrales bacterium]|nr:polymer-forming cytoskeletal protein [Candidatus Acidoferrales bacterium]
MDQIVDMEEAAAPARGRGRHSNGTSGVNIVVLGPRDSLSGNLIVEGDVRIEGSVEGEVRASGDIDIEASANARARLEARNVTVRGNVNGHIVAAGKLSVGGSGTVTGDVRAARLRVDDGATVNGNVTMGAGEAPGETS